MKWFPLLVLPSLLAMAVAPAAASHGELPACPEATQHLCAAHPEHDAGQCLLCRMSGWTPAVEFPDVVGVFRQAEPAEAAPQAALLEIPFFAAGSPRAPPAA